jgi:hypothetical protein
MVEIVGSIVQYEEKIGKVGCEIQFSQFNH